MSNQSQQHDVKAAVAAIDDYESLFPRHVGGPAYRVLSVTDGQPTAYKTDVKALTCSCPDEQFNREDDEVCKHLAAALEAHPRKLSTEAQLHQDLCRRLQQLDEAVQQVRDEASPAEPQEQVSADPAAQQAGQQAQTNGKAHGSETANHPDEPAGGSNPDLQQAEDNSALLDLVDSWGSMSVPGWEFVELELGSHDGDHGVRLDPDSQSMKDSDYESFKDRINSFEESSVHVGFGDDPCFTCGESDGDFFYHFPERLVRTQFGGGA